MTSDDEVGIKTGMKQQQKKMRMMMDQDSSETYRRWSTPSFTCIHSSKPAKLTSNWTTVSHVFIHVHPSGIQRPSQVTKRMKSKPKFLMKTKGTWKETKQLLFWVSWTKKRRRDCARKQSCPKFWRETSCRDHNFLEGQHTLSCHYNYTTRYLRKLL